MNFASFKENMDTAVVQSVKFDNIIRQNIIKSQIPKT